MTLQEAIKILSSFTDRSKPPLYPDFRDAKQLGIEAMKRINTQRDWGFVSNKKLLPGETRE